MRDAEVKRITVLDSRVVTNILYYFENLELLLKTKQMTKRLVDLNLEKV